MPRKPIKPAPLTSGSPDQAKRVMADVKSRSRPVGGVDEVSIPPLDAEPMTGPDGRGLTMHEQAETLKDPANPLSPYYDPALAEQQRRGQAARSAQMDPHALRAAQQGHEQAQAPQGPFGGVLNPEAQADPSFRPGVGSMYAGNQPGLQKGSKRSKVLKKETVEGIEALRQFNEEAAELQKKQLEEAQDDEKTPVEKLAEEMGIENPEEFFSQFRAEVDELNTPELRKSIEDRCEELSIEQLIEEGEVRQDVPIVRAKFIPTFRTVTGDEDLSIKRRLYGVQGGEQYIYDLMGMSHLTAGLYAINSRPLPSHLDDTRQFNEALFKKKFKIVKSYPLSMVASLSINFTWFDKRTRKLFIDIEPLKNG